MKVMFFKILNFVLLLFILVFLEFANKKQKSTKTSYKLQIKCQPIRFFLIHYISSLSLSSLLSLLSLLYLYSLHPGGQRGPHLAVRPQACFLQPGPDALDAACVLRVAGGVPTHALVLLHQRVVHQT